MDAALRAATIYAFLLVIFRIAGRRTLSQMTSFDFVLLLVISEAASNALLGDDFSITNGLLIITFLVAIDVSLSMLKGKSARFAKAIDGIPMIIVDRGAPLRQRMKRARVDEDDVLEAARKTQGLESLSQIKYAVLEIDGVISIIPAEKNSQLEA